MARLDIAADRIRVHLDWWEKLAVRRSHLTIPMHAVEHVDVVSDAGAALGDGRYEHATRIPGITAAGTLTTEDSEGRRTFAVCHRNLPGLVLTLNRATYHRIVLSTSHAEGYARQIEDHLAAGT